MDSTAHGAEDGRLVILAEGMLDFHHGKTATSILRYRPERVVAVIDSTRAGRTSHDVLGIGGATPIVSSVREALAFAPTALLIGIAPTGGGLPQEWREQILEAIAAGLDVISGLHSMLNEDPELAGAAARSGVSLIDVRKPPLTSRVAELRPHRAGARVVTFVGSDCAVGKMTSALEVVNCARDRGLSAAFVATGQTGIMLEGSGIAIDRVIGDFMAGAVEQLVLDAAASADWVFVEGQGSLLHPGYSGVTLALLHGSAPDAMILVHDPTRENIDEYAVPIPPLPELIKIYESAAGWVKPSRVVAICLNTRALSEDDAREAIRHAHEATGLAVTDAVRFGAEPVVDALEAAFEVHAAR